MKATMTTDRFVSDNWDEQEVKSPPLRAKPWASLRGPPRLTEWGRCVSLNAALTLTECRRSPQ